MQATITFDDRAAGVKLNLQGGTARRRKAEAEHFDTFILPLVQDWRAFIVGERDAALGAELVKRRVGR